jgi:outer membrane protein TolC
LRLQNAKNQAVWEVNQSVSAVQQARDQFDAALKLAILTRQVRDVQLKRHDEAPAAVEDTISAQRNVALAEGHVVRARANYAKALIRYEEATGTLLERNNIEMSDAISGFAAPTNSLTGPGCPSFPPAQKSTGTTYRFE